MKLKESRIYKKKLIFQDLDIKKYLGRCLVETSRENPPKV